MSTSRGLGVLLTLALSVLAAGAVPLPARAASAFPPGSEGYHTYTEMVAEIKAAATAYPDIVSISSIGRSYEGRKIWMAKVSDNVALDEDEPEVMFDGGIHAREHMSVEMTLALFGLLTDHYGDTDALGQRVTHVVDSREVFIIFMVNPDGAEYDISGGQFHYWRKNRQPTPGSSSIGTDLNRNFGYHWGCCGGSSSNPAVWNYRGPAPWSAPESRVMRDFVDSRVVGGVQQIRTAVSFHTQGRLVMWPYGWTQDDIPSDMTADDHAAFVAMGTSMAASNGYTPEQSSDLYATSGSKGDWMYSQHRIFVFTFEMTVGRYPPDTLIGPETSRNFDALLYIAEEAGCPYRAAGLEARHCGPFSDDLEVARGWRVDPDGTDTATAGAWQRADPEWSSDAAGIRQAGATTSGRRGFVTGASAGASTTSNDLDGGVTTAQSKPFALPVGSGYELRFRWTFAHDAASSTADRLRVSLVDGAGDATPVFTVLGDATDRLAVWKRTSVDISSFAGSTVSVRLEAADDDGPSLVEAAVDDVMVVTTGPTAEEQARRPVDRPLKG